MWLFQKLNMVYYLLGLFNCRLKTLWKTSQPLKLINRLNSTVQLQINEPVSFVALFNDDVIFFVRFEFAVLYQVSNNFCKETKKSEESVFKWFLFIDTMTECSMDLDIRNLQNQIGWTYIYHNIAIWVPLNLFNHTSWMTVVPPSDRPKSVRNHCVIEVLVAFMHCQLFFFFLVV